MQKLFLLLFTSFAFFSLSFSQGGSIATATALALNGSASGTISDASRDHYWKITTTANGYVRVQINSAQSIDVDVTFYDVNGTTQFMGDGRAGTYSEVFGFLKPGTYYIHAFRWSGTTGSYTISNSFATPARAPDVEPNDLYTTAIALSPNGTSTGHIGFFGNGATDLDDWWKITITEDGWLRVQVRADSLDLRGDVALDIDIDMYDVNGATLIHSDGRFGTFSEVAAFLRPGTYYVREVTNVPSACHSIR